MTLIKNIVPNYFSTIKVGIKTKFERYFLPYFSSSLSGAKRPASSVGAV